MKIVARTQNQRSSQDEPTQMLCLQINGSNLYVVEWHSSEWIFEWRSCSRCYCWNSVQCTSCCTPGQTIAVCTLQGYRTITQKWHRALTTYD